MFIPVQLKELEECFCHRSYFLDQDWTQSSKREGTFVLDSESSSRPSSGRASTSTPMKTSLLESKSRSASINRIPVRKQTSSTPDSSNHLVNGKSHSSSDELIQVASALNGKNLYFWLIFAS